jgi:hypothetical protein
MRSVANIQVVILVSGGVELCYIVLGPVVGSDDESTGQVLSGEFAQQVVLFIPPWSVAKASGDDRKELVAPSIGRMMRRETLRERRPMFELE